MQKSPLDLKLCGGSDGFAYGVGIAGGIVSLLGDPASEVTKALGLVLALLVLLLFVVSLLVLLLTAA